MANIAKKNVETRTFPQICAGISNGEWLAIRDRIVLKTGKAEQTIYLWRDGRTKPTSLVERKAVAEVVNTVLGTNCNHKYLFPID